jgi:hypothetical protein
VGWNIVDGKSIVGKDKMNFNELRKMAKGIGVNTYRLKKLDIIRSIQISKIQQRQRIDV